MVVARGWLLEGDCGIVWQMEGIKLVTCVERHADSTELTDCPLS